MDDIERRAVQRADAYRVEHKILHLHYMGYAVRKYCLPEDEFRFVLHGKHYLTTKNGKPFEDTLIVDGEVCILSETLRSYGEVAA